MDDLVLDFDKLELAPNSHGYSSSTQGGRMALFGTVSHRTLRALHIRISEGQPSHDIVVDTDIVPLSGESQRQRRSACNSETLRGERENVQDCDNESKTTSVASQAELVFSVNVSHDYPAPELYLSPELGRASVIFGLNDDSHAPIGISSTIGPMPSLGGRMRFFQSPRMSAPHPAAGFRLEAKLPDQCILPPEKSTCQPDDGPHSSYNNPRAHSTDSAKAATNSEPSSSLDPELSPHEEEENTSAFGIDVSTLAAEPEHENATAGMTEQGMLDSGSSHSRDIGIEVRKVDAKDAQEDSAEEDHIPMSYQIPPATLRAAMVASPNSAGSYYSQALYRGPEDRLISIHYCATMEIAERVAPYFLKEKVIGFDIEWKPYGTSTKENGLSIKENASLIQIACEDRIALFHIALYKGTTAEELLPPTLRTIIESPDIVKTGVAIKGDFKRLRDYLEVEAKGVFELSRLHNLVENYENDKKKSNSWKLYALAKQVHEHLQLPMYKGEVRESDWSSRLTLSQIQYAATDAYASFRLYDALEEKRKKLRPIPPRPELCDFDSVSRPRASPRPKAAKKAVEPVEAVEAVEAAETVAQAATQADTDQDSVYETAEEDLADSQELEKSSGSDSSSEEADLNAEPDVDFVPSSSGSDLGQLEQKRPGDVVSIPRQIQRVGRVKLKSLVGPDPCYPTLPILPSEEGESNSEPGFDPPPVPDKPPKRRVARKGDTSREAVPDDNHEMAFSEKSRAEENEHSMGNTEEAEEAQASPSEEGNQESTSSSGTTRKKRSTKASPSEPVPEPTSEAAASSPAAQPLQPTTTPMPPKSPEYLLADSWAQSYLFDSIPPPSAAAAPSRIRASIPHLRAYHLWHHQQLSLDAIAHHLRDPPLAESTVCSYILQAISFEKLEYGREELKGVLRALPPSVRMGRWRWFVERVGGV